MPLPSDEGAVPNVLAYPADEAKAILEQAGVRVGEVVTTGPPGRRPEDGQVRVVQQIVRPDGSVALTVAAEYRRAEAE